MMHPSTLAATVLVPAALAAPIWALRPAEVTPVCAIEGTGAASPLEGMTVTVEAAVTAVFTADLKGFFVQQVGCDGDPASSDGLFVYDPGSLAATEAGDVIRATGTVKEYRGLTELQLAEAQVVGQAPLPPAVDLDPPSDPAAAQVYLEAREGMLVAMDAARVVGATNSYGEAYVTPLASGVTRFYRDTVDGRKIGLEIPGSWLALNHGDVLRGISGPLDWRFGSFRVALASANAVTVEAADREAQTLAPAPAGALRIATYNLENLFDDVNEPGKSDPVASPEEYRAAVARRARSIASALGGVDILAVQEVENLGVLEDLAAAAPLAAADLGAVLVDGPDARGIDVGLLFNRRRLELVEAAAHQKCVEEKPPLVDIPCSLPGGAPGWGLYSRPPLVATFADVAGRRLTIIANHFKSKRGGEGVTTPTRVAMAEHNLALFRDLKTAAPDTPVLVAGDLNDFEDSSPLRALTGTGELRDLHGVDDYTYVFGGVSEILDYVLVEDGAVDIVASGPVHTNVDFAAPEPGSPGAGPRVSDHDPVAVTLRLKFPTMLYLPAARNGSARGGAPETPAPPTATRSATPPPAPVPSATPPATATAAAGPPGHPLHIDGVFYDGVTRAEADEYVALTNVSSAPVVLTQWRLNSVRAAASRPQEFTFPHGFTMAPGQTCRVYTDEIHDEWCGLSFRSGQAIWNNQGDKAQLRDADGVLIDWWCYGGWSDRCRP